MRDFFSGRPRKGIDKCPKTCIIVFVRQNIAGLCKGSTADSDSVCEGSNPSPAASEQKLKILYFQGVLSFFLSLAKLFLRGSWFQIFQIFQILCVKLCVKKSGKNWGVRIIPSGAHEKGE